MTNQNTLKVSCSLSFIEKDIRDQSAVLIENICSEANVVWHARQFLFANDSDCASNTKCLQQNIDRVAIQNLYLQLESHAIATDSRAGVAIVVAFLISCENEQLMNQHPGYVTNPVIVKKLLSSFETIDNFDARAWFLLSKLFLALCSRCGGFMDSSVLYSLCNYCMSFSVKLHLIEADEMIKRKSKEHGVTELDIVDISNAAPYDMTSRSRALAAARQAFDQSCWHIFQSLGVSSTR